MAKRPIRPDEIHEKKRRAALRAYLRNRKPTPFRNYHPPIGRVRNCEHDFEAVPCLAGNGYKVRCRRCGRMMRRKEDAA